MLMTHTIIITFAGAWAIIKVSGHQHRWLAGDYDLEIGIFEVDSMVVTWWIVAFCPVDYDEMRYIGSVISCDITLIQLCDVS